MNTNTETTVTTTEQQTDAVTTEATAAATEPTQQIENGATDTQDVQATTYSEEEVAKRIQSEADKVRTKYVEKVKALEAKLAELSPTLTPAEIEMRERLEALEAQQAEVARKEAFLDLQTKLSEASLPKTMATYLNGDIDIAEFAKLIDNIVVERNKGQGYQPSQHAPADGMTPEKWRKLSYSQRAELYDRDPTTYSAFIKT